jgi:5-methylcytosine-specific restriction endonuclease McrA
VPGCRVPFERCHVHHIRYWEDGGPSDLWNLVPLCNTHHHCVHEGGWQLTIDRRTYVLTITRPDGSIETTGPPHARAG